MNGALRRYFERYRDAGPTGEYRLTLTVGAKKVRADSVDNKTEIPMDEWVEIGVFAAGEGDELGEPLSLERHRIRRGEQTIRVIVPREPARAGIDPYRKLDPVGEEAVNGALRRYFERYRDAGPPYPTSLDLHAELRWAGSN